jgi:hypothetical protein
MSRLSDEGPASLTRRREEDRNPLFARSRAAAKETSDELRSLRNQVSQLRAIIFSAEQIIDALYHAERVDGYARSKVKEILEKARGL